jgi:hypothetical protein
MSDDIDPMTTDEKLDIRVQYWSTSLTRFDIKDLDAEATVGYRSIPFLLRVMLTLNTHSLLSPFMAKKKFFE